jgi:hypothetical protein
MPKFVTEEPFTSLARGLERLNLDSLISNALEESADEAVEALRELHQHAGADEPLVKAIRSFKDQDGGWAAGVPDSDRQAGAAHEFEYGSIESIGVSPHALFRVQQQSMSQQAAENLTSILSKGVTG